MGPALTGTQHMKYSGLQTRTSLIALALAATAAAGCTMKSQEAPPLSGPSEQGTSIVITASPDQITQDGASQSLITAIARDQNGQAMRNAVLRAAISVDGSIVDFGQLSAKTLVTGNDGRATLVYTAPPPVSGNIAVDTNTVVTIQVTPSETDFANALPRVVNIRLLPQGFVVPPAGLSPAFTFNPTTPTDNQTVVFDATSSRSPANNPIADYTWNFGDGRAATGPVVSHAFQTAGTYAVTLTIRDSIGRSGSTSQAVTVSAGTNPTATIITSPAEPAPGQAVQFNGTTSRPAPGRTITSYRWDFGDGTTGTGATTSHVYTAVGAYRVVLIVTDDAGRTATATAEVAVAVVAPPGGTIR
jgi:PKD repeat protein